MDKNYREIIINVSNCLGDARLYAEALNVNFKKTDISASIDKFFLKIRAVQVDIEKYRIFLGALDICNPIFRETVFDKVDALSYSISRGKRKFVNYNKDRKVINRKEKVKNRSVYYYADFNTFSRENVNLPDEYENKIVCADSLEFLKNLPDNCVDLIFTSPPYNFGLDYEGHDDTNKWREYYDVLFAIFDECIRVLKWGGRIVVNVQPLYSDYIPTHHIISNFFMQRKMIWKSEIIWEKNNYNCKFCSFGSWKSPSSPYMKYTWEYLEVFCKGELKKKGKSENADIDAEEFKSWTVAKWSIAPERKMKEYGHPAMFPESLAERVLKLFSFKGDTVMDPFNGAGTTTVVANKLSRKYLGVDISDEYCSIARERIRLKQTSLI